MIILGISGGFGHDPAACIVRDGVLIAMAEEERFARIKRAHNLPAVAATIYCLKEAGIALEEVGIIATAWDPGLEKYSTVFKERFNNFIHHPIFRNKKLPPIIHVNHHVAHAAASFYASGYNEASIIVVDGQGEEAATTIAHGKGQDINVVASFDASQSIGYFYSAVTNFIGFASGSSGKTMGLAAYGRPLYEFDNINFDSDGYSFDIKIPKDTPTYEYPGTIRNQWLKWLNNKFGKVDNILFDLDINSGRILRNLDLDDLCKNIAASAQQTLERLIIHLVQIAVRTIGSRNMVLGGGVALNCAANGAILRSGLIDNLYIFPAAHDGGGALGAALYVAAQYREAPNRLIDHAYWGPEYSNESIFKILKRLGINAKEYDDIGDKVADIICDGATVGWFQGRMEIGPRALGHRSILANATEKKNVLLVNNVKEREIWRPFAPSLFYDEAMEFLESPTLSPFMLQAFYTRQKAKEIIPAVVHVDGSTRPHIPTSSTSQHYVNLLLGMKKRIGKSIVLNTSFNGSNEPIVCTPLDALRTFFSSGLDALAIGNFLIEKVKI